MRRVEASVLAVLLCWAGAAKAEPNRYAIDPARSHVIVHVGKEGLFSFAGHEHQILGRPAEGTLVVDPENVTQSTVEVRFDAVGLRVTGQGEPREDVPKVQAAMLGPKCLDAARFPTIRFVSRTVTATHVSGGHYDLAISGDLTLHGVTRLVTVPVGVDFLEDRLTAQGHVTIRQSDFGMTPITVAGVVKVKDELMLEWILEGRPADGGPKGPGAP